VLTNANSAAIHDVFERAEWIEAPGAPQTFAPHLKSATLPGVPIKRILFQFAWGDRLVVNPANSALVRAANMRESTSIYRHDRAREVVPALPADPHSHLAWASGIAGVPAVPIGIAAFQQAAGFVLSGGMQIPDANAVVRLVYGRDLFETPETLPERLNFAP
jgi:hypothetical protein